MEEKQRWRLKKCCCFPLRSGALFLAYFTVIKMLILDSLTYGFTIETIGTMFDMLGVSPNNGTFYVAATTASVIQYTSVLVSIYALHEKNARLIFAYMCYLIVCMVTMVVLCFCCYFGMEVYSVGLGNVVDLVFNIFTLLVLYSVRIEILQEEMELVPQTQSVREAETLVPLAKPDPDDVEKTSI